MNIEKIYGKVMKTVPVIKAFTSFWAKLSPPPKLLSGVFDYLKEPVGDCFTVGFGKAPIVPEDVLRKTYYMAGYHSNHPVTAVQDPTYARAVWIDDNSGKGGILLVAVDCVGLLSPDVKNIRSLLEPFKDKTGCRAVNIMSTHNHAGIDTMGLWGKLPRSGRDTHFINNILYTGILSAAENAYRDRSDGDLFLGRTKGEDIQHDIRTPDVFSKTITRLRFAPKDGSRNIHIINFAAHAETMDCHSSVLSADWPAFLCQKIMLDTRGDETIFFNGAIGGMITPIEKGKNNVETTVLAGEAVANASLTIKDEIKLSPKISVLRQSFSIPVYNIVLAAAGIIKIIPRSSRNTGEGPLGISVITEMNYLEIGDEFQVLMLPGELFPELAYGGYLPEGAAANGSPDKNPKPLVEIAENPNLVIFGLANDEIGYILPPNDYMLHETMPFLEDGYEKSGRKHYEETNSVGIETAQRIADTFELMMKTVNEAKKE